MNWREKRSDLERRNVGFVPIRSCQIGALEEHCLVAIIHFDPTNPILGFIHVIGTQALFVFFVLVRTKESFYTRLRLNPLRIAWGINIAKADVK